METLFDRNLVPVEDQVGEVEAGEPPYPRPGGLQAAADALETAPGGGRCVGAHLREEGGAGGERGSQVGGVPFRGIGESRRGADA